MASQAQRLSEIDHGRGVSRRFAGLTGLAMLVLGGLVLLPGSPPLPDRLTAWLPASLHARQWFPIRRVRVEGQFRHLTPEQVQAAVMRQIDGGFFDLDVNRIRRAVLADPWVRSVEVRREWPDSLRVQVDERQAVARWGRRSFISASGELFSPRTDAAGSDLPQMNGPPRMHRSALSLLRKCNHQLAPLGLQVSRLEVSERRAWRATLSNGLQLQLGRLTDTDDAGAVDDAPASSGLPYRFGGQFSEHSLMRRFVHAYPKVFAGREDRVVSIDLRYTNGFSVRWKSEGKEVKDGKISG